MTETRALPCALPDTPLAAARPGIDACVHCGFCLQACPTYVTLEDENDSPRGRIVLMRSLLEGELALDDPDVRTHIDRCLGCRGCETACPSGVPYGQLLEATRATLTLARPAPLVARIILGVFARPVLLRASLTGARLFRATGLPALLSRLPGRIGFAMAMLASTSPSFPRRRYEPTPPERQRGSVALLRGCVMDGLYGHVHEATERTLRANGYAPCGAPGQRCCGALHAHAGDLETARELARVNVDAFERSGAEQVVVNSAGCGAMMKEYAHLLADDPEWAERARAISLRVRDVSELLAEAGPAPAGPLPVRVTYDAPCHLLHGQRVVRPPLRVLEAVDGLELVPLTDADMCCGSAGIYNLIEPDTSDAVLDPKLRNIRDTGVPWVATGNPGCMMQIGAGLRRHGIAARVVHPVEVLDAGYGRVEDRK
ncbi:MAG TPA: heterodisulfide reductase-related iron-sulfur binding cluster [Gemmatimonadales bacterium]